MQAKQLCLLQMACTGVAVQLCVAELDRHLESAVLALYCVALVCWRAPLRLPSQQKASAGQQCQHAVLCGQQMCAECVQQLLAAPTTSCRLVECQSMVHCTRETAHAAEKKRKVYAGRRGLWEALHRPIAYRPLKGLRGGEGDGEVKLGGSCGFSYS